MKGIQFAVNETKEQNKRVQFILDISPEMYQTLNDLTVTTKEDNATILLKALALMEVAVEAKQQGKHLWIADENNNLESEIIGI